MQLYMESYKNISVVLGNVDKIIKNTNVRTPSGASVVNNTQVNITSTEAVSTADLLNKMRIAKLDSK